MCAVLDLVRKTLLLTALGFLVVVVSGPLFAVLGAILPFFLVGLAVYLPYRVLYQKRPITWAGARQTGEAVSRVVFGVPIWVGQKVWYGARAPLVGLGYVVGGTVRFTRRVVVETLAGGAVGGVLGAIGGMDNHDLELRVPLGIALGAGVGLLVGAFWRDGKKVPTPKLASPSDLRGPANAQCA